MGDLVAVDTETMGLYPQLPGKELLGVSVATERLATCQAFYVTLHGNSSAALKFEVRDWLQSLTNVVGQNFAFDANWIKAKLGIDVAFKHDTQLMWYLSMARHANQRQSFSLKVAETQVLGWETSNDGPLKENLIKNGAPESEPMSRMELADLSVCAEYASLDAFATLELFKNLQPFFEKYDYWDFLHFLQDYRGHLNWAERSGVPVNKEKLQEYVKQAREGWTGAIIELRSICEKEIKALEDEWFEEDLASFKSERGKEAFRKAFTRHRRFNTSSDPHVAQLLYGQLGFPVTERTPKGKPKTNKLALKQIDHPAARLLLKSSKLEKLVTSFAEPYLAAISGYDGRIHARLSCSTTVTGRCNGFDPNMQQAPFKERALMECFEMPPGMVGVHMDLVSIEPFFTAYFSQDPLLLKIYRDGLGDIYLDLALRLFPNDLLLKTEYKPNEKPTEEIKEKFRKVRDVSKTVHLACQYGGGARTIARTLTLNGFPTSEDEARRIVKAYWQAFAGVKHFEKLLYDVYSQDGFLRNPFGRIVRIPDWYCKDLLSRFIQGTASDCLKFIVDKIVKTTRLRALNVVEYINVAPLLIDTHDATSWLVPESLAEEFKSLIENVISEVNSELQLDMPIRGSIKLLKTAADIK